MMTISMISCDLITFLVLIGSVGSTHFHGAHFWFQPADDWTPDRPIVQISFRIYWKLDYSRTTRCTPETIASGQLIGPETPGYLECVGGCTPSRSRVSGVSIRCLAYSELENWMYGERNHSYTLPASASQIITLEWAGDGWFSNDGPWQLRMMVNATRRNDTARMNSSPHVLLPQLPFTVQLGCSLSVSLHVVDDDGDEVRCRWAERSRQECASVCHSSVDVTLNQTSCGVEFGVQTRPGMYVIAIQVEDYIRGQTRTTPFSSVPLQVSVTVLGHTTAECEGRPVITSPAEDGQCLRPPVNQTLSFIHSYTVRVLARSKDIYTRIPDISVSWASNDVIVTSSDVAQLSVNGNLLYYIDVSISSKDDVTDDIITTRVCFVATDNFGRSSDVRCVNSDFGPNLVPRAQRLEYNAATSRLTVYFDQMVKRARSSSLLRIYKVDASDGQPLSPVAIATTAAAYDTSKTDQVHVASDHISIELPESISTSSDVYSVLLQTGAVISARACSVNSASVTDLSLLTFNASSTDGIHIAVTQVTDTLTSRPMPSAGPNTGRQRENEAWIYRWLIAVVCISTVFIVAILIVVVVATRRRRKSRDRRFDDDIELKRRQEKYFSTLRTTNGGYYNWTYDPNEVYST